MVPPFSTTKTRVVSPSGAVTYTGAAKSPTLASVTVAARAAPGTTTRAAMARTMARRTAGMMPGGSGDHARSRGSGPLGAPGTPFGARTRKRGGPARRPRAPS